MIHLLGYALFFSVLFWLKGDKGVALSIGIPSYIGITLLVVRALRRKEGGT